MLPTHVHWRHTRTCLALHRRQAECAKTARIQMALPPGGKAPPAGAPTANLYEELGDGSMWVGREPSLSPPPPHLPSCRAQVAPLAVGILFFLFFLRYDTEICTLEGVGWALCCCFCCCCYMQELLHLLIPQRTVVAYLATAAVVKSAPTKDWLS